MSAEILALVWCRTDTEETVTEITVPRQLYDDIVRTRAAWALISQVLTDRPFVDMQKTFMGEGSIAAQ